MSEKIVSRSFSKQGKDNWDKIFKKNKSKIKPLTVDESNIKPLTTDDSCITPMTEETFEKWNDRFKISKIEE